jgi:hypothetical protein
MIRNFFWLTDIQFGKLKPNLPTDTRGRPRVDDRRVISGGHVSVFWRYPATSFAMQNMRA